MGYRGTRTKTLMCSTLGQIIYVEHNSDTTVLNKYSKWVSLKLHAINVPETKFSGKFLIKNQQGRVQICRFILLQTAHPATRFGQLSWPSSGRCSLKGILHRMSKQFTNIKTDSVVQWLACWPLAPKFAGSNPAEAVGFFALKNPQYTFLRRGSKNLSHVPALRHVKKPSNLRELRIAS